VTASFLKAGLTENELCVWILPHPLTIHLATEELSRHGFDGARLQATKQLQLVTAHDCWFATPPFDVECSLMRLVSLSAMARQCGYASVRAAGGPGPFLSETSRQVFMRYEYQATEVISEHPCIGLCCYPWTHLATDMFDIMSTHPGALVRTQTGWTSI
jgi:hypothetical protein